MWRRALLAQMVWTLASTGDTSCVLLEDDDDDRVCTTEERPSIELTLLDEDGDVVESAIVFYTVDGGCKRALACEVCEGVTVGTEESGTFELEIQADYFETAVEVVEVTADECHVETQKLELLLEVLECTDETEAPLVLSLWDTAGEAISSATIFHQVDEGPEQQIACGNELDVLCDSVPLLGSAGAGYHEVRIEADGFQSKTFDGQIARCECDSSYEVFVELLRVDEEEPEVLPCPPAPVPPPHLILRDEEGASLTRADVFLKRGGCLVQTVGCKENCEFVGTGNADQAVIVAPGYAIETVDTGFPKSTKLGNYCPGLPFISVEVFLRPCTAEAE